MGRGLGALRRGGWGLGLARGSREITGRGERANWHHILAGPPGAGARDNRRRASSPGPVQFLPLSSGSARVPGTGSTGEPGALLSLLLLKNQLKVSFPKGILQDGRPVVPRQPPLFLGLHLSRSRPCLHLWPLSFGPKPPLITEVALMLALGLCPFLLCPHLNLSTSARPTSKQATLTAAGWARFGPCPPPDRVVMELASESGCVDTRAQRGVGLLWRSRERIKSRPLRFPGAAPLLP